MAPDSHWYVPVFRAKAGEFDALAKLTTHGTDTTRLMPFFEPMPTDEQNDPLTTLRKIATNLACCWGAPSYVDLVNFPPSPNLGGRHPLAIFLEETSLRKIEATPVIGLSHDTGYQNALSEWRSSIGNRSKPICVRVSSNDLNGAGVETAISAIVRHLDCPVGNVDLLVDCKYLAPGAATYRLLLDRIPHVLQWRSLILAGSSVPKDLQHLKVGDIAHEARQEWIEWKNLPHGRTSVVRHPTFGDYGIRHPNFADEAVEKANYVPRSNSASFRYSVDDTFLVLRGQSISSGGAAQYLGQCALLASRSEYYGPGYSAGDRMVWEGKEKLERGDINHPGNATTWLAAMTNHHITLTLNQIASLS